MTKPYRPMYVCDEMGDQDPELRDRFDESQLVGLHFDSAERLASKHGFAFAGKHH